ncbi:MAG TPA: DUF424 family protein [Candidatus Nanoarchaeia archaeon]|nr:DUF424 family protein [Candidatus Nanoarchaeia archaeon]
MKLFMRVINEREHQVNICDEELIGKKLNEVTISEHFYGEVTNDREIIEEIKKSTMINALGERAVEIVESVKGELDVIVIEGIPHVMVVTLI